MRQRQRPSKRENRVGQCDPHDVFEHPAFGMIGVNVVTGGDRHLFGSDIEHGQRIKITVRRAEMHRNLSHDWPYGRAELIEVELSHSQFAELITSPGKGDGVPCTITALKGEMIPAIDVLETKAETFRREIEQSARRRLDEIREQIDALGALIESGKTGKTALRDIHKDLTRLAQQLPGSVSFVVRQAEEALEKAQSAAKIEIEAFVNHQINRIGLDAARQIGLTPSTQPPKEIE